MDTANKYHNTLKTYSHTVKMTPPSGATSKASVPSADTICSGANAG